jgi:Flp pilus assembly protein TadG
MTALNPRERSERHERVRGAAVPGLRRAGVRDEPRDDEGRHRQKGALNPRERSERHEHGSMAVEAVLLAPVMLIFLLFIVGAARIVEARGEVDGAARDAARAASIQRDFGAAGSAAVQTAKELDCAGGGPSVSLSGSDWIEGGSVRVTIGCDVDLSAVSGFGFAPTLHMTGTSVVPLETFRRIG